MMDSWDAITYFLVNYGLYSLLLLAQALAHWRTRGSSDSRCSPMAPVRMGVSIRTKSRL